MNHCVKTLGAHGADDGECLHGRRPGIPCIVFFAPPSSLSVLHRPRQKVEARSGKKSVTTLRKHVRTTHEARPLQAFGYRAPNDPAIRPHGAWNLFRRGLFPGDHPSPLLVVRSKHYLIAIRTLNVEPGDQTRILEIP